MAYLRTTSNVASAEQLSWEASVNQNFIRTLENQF